MAKWYEVTAGMAAMLALSACGGGAGNEADSGARHTEGASVPYTPEVPADENRLAAGMEHTVGLSADGKTVYVWGRSDAGQTNMAPTAISMPLQGMSGVQVIQSVKAGGNFSVVLSGGQVWVVTASGSKQVTGFSAVKAIAAGQSHVLMLQQDGNVWGWGRGGNLAGNATPAVIPGLSNVKAIAAGQDYSVALTDDGSVWSWGNNLQGQLGQGSAGAMRPPAKVAGIDGVKAIAAGMAHVVVLKQDGTVWGWGNNSYGQLGGTAHARPYPVQVQGLPAPVAGLSGVRSVSAGAYNSGIVHYNGSVWTWGNNTFGQLGDGTTAVSFAPKKVNAISNAVSMAIGAGHIAVLRSDGAVYSFGRNTSGQLGTNTTSGSNIPVQAVGVGGVGNLNLGPSANH